MRKLPGVVFMSQASYSLYPDERVRVSGIQCSVLGCRLQYFLSFYSLGLRAAHYLKNRGTTVKTQM